MKRKRKYTKRPSPKSVLADMKRNAKEALADIKADQKRIAGKCKHVNLPATFGQMAPIKRGPGRPRKNPTTPTQWSITEDARKQGYRLDASGAIVGPITHHLKTWPQYFQASFAGEKPFEIRQNDRNFQRWDYLVLEEWNPETEKYTGRVLSRRIDSIVTGPKFGLKQGWVVMGLSKV